MVTPPGLHTAGAPVPSGMGEYDAQQPTFCSRGTTHVYACSPGLHPHPYFNPNPIAYLHTLRVTVTQVLWAGLTSGSLSSDTASSAGLVPYSAMSACRKLRDCAGYVGVGWVAVSHDWVCAQHEQSVTCSRT